MYEIWVLNVCSESLLQLECHSISISNPKLTSLFSMERGKRDLENESIDRNLRLEKWHSERNRM